MHSLARDGRAPARLEGVVRLSATDGFQRLYRRAGGRRGAAPPSRGVGGDHRRHPARQPTAFQRRYRGRGRRARRYNVRTGDPAGRLQPGPVRLPRIPGPARHTRRCQRTLPTTQWSTSSNPCCRSTNWTSPPVSPRAMRQSVPSTSMFSCMLRRPAPPRAWACCPASWPTRHTDLARVLPEAVSVQLELLAGDPRRDTAQARGGGHHRRDL